MAAGVKLNLDTKLISLTFECPFSFFLLGNCNLANQPTTLCYEIEIDNAYTMKNLEKQISEPLDSSLGPGNSFFPRSSCACYLFYCYNYNLKQDK